MVALVSPNKVDFDDTLEDIGGVCLFDSNDYRKYPFVSDLKFLKNHDKTHWNSLGLSYHSYVSEPAYIRFVNPCSTRFGSIARIERPSYTYHSWSYRNPVNQQSETMKVWNSSRNFSAELAWSKRSSRPGFYLANEQVEYLPNYTGDTVWAYDPERKKRKTQVIPTDRLGRDIAVGDFITYILYQFDGKGAAGIYFGNVTKIDHDGGVWAKNVGLNSTARIEDRRIKDNSLITILTDDLMKQLMLAKLSNY